MTLKIMINGQMETIASRRTKPVTFINGVKKRLTKGVTFINGEKVKLWGFDQQIEVFGFTPHSSIYTEPLVSIDSARLITYFNSYGSGATVLYNIENLSGVTKIANYSWGGDAIYDPVASDSTKVVFNLKNKKTRNTISYSYGANSMSVSSAFTGTALSTDSYNWMARLSNGNTLWGFADSYRSGGIVLMAGYLGLGNNVVWSETNVTRTTMSSNVVFNGTDTVYNAVSGIGGTYAIYANTSSGHTNIGTAPYGLSMCDGSDLVCSGSGGIAKITSAGVSIWNQTLPNNATGNYRTAILLGKAVTDDLYYVLDIPRTGYTVSDQNVYLRKYDATTGSLIETIVANYYDTNDNLITRWSCVAHRSDSGYLGATYTSGNTGYVMRVYVGS